MIRRKLNTHCCSNIALSASRASCPSYSLSLRLSCLRQFLRGIYWIYHVSYINPKVLCTEKRYHYKICQLGGQFTRELHRFQDLSFLRCCIMAILGVTSKWVAKRLRPFANGCDHLQMAATICKWLLKRSRPFVDVFRLK